jgi:hypothetical protein
MVFDPHQLELAPPFQLQIQFFVDRFVDLHLQIIIEAKLLHLQRLKTKILA